MKSLFWGIVVVLFCGCTPFGGFKAPPNIYKLYQKKNISVFETQKALLECGYEDVYLGGYPRNSSEEYHKQWPLRHNCMVKDGFVYTLSNTPPCEQPATKNYSACQPDAVIPTRSVERRLNSVFCKQYPRAQVCQPSGQDVVPHTEETTPLPKTFVPQSRSTEQANQLQRDIQKQNNRQMNNMLKSTAPKIKR